MFVLVKTTATIHNLRLDKDEQRLDISCGGDLKVIVTVERSKTEGHFDCSASGEATPRAEIAADLNGSIPGLQLLGYLRATEIQLKHYLNRAIRLLMWRRGMRVDYGIRSTGEAFWSLDGKQWNPLGIIVGI